MHLDLKIIIKNPPEDRAGKDALAERLEPEIKSAVDDILKRNNLDGSTHPINMKISPARGTRRVKWKP